MTFLLPVEAIGDEGSTSFAASNVDGKIIVPDDLAPDTRPARAAWQPGNHVRRCVKCDARFRGGRLAMECAPCAYGGAD